MNVGLVKPKYQQANPISSLANPISSLGHLTQLHNGPSSHLNNKLMDQIATSLCQLFKLFCVLFFISLSFYIIEKLENGIKNSI